MANIKIPWDDWTLAQKKPIGRGGFGEVYEIKRNMYGLEEKAAMKILSIPKDESDLDALRFEGLDDDSIAKTYHGYVSNMVKEYETMQKLRNNPHVVHVYDLQVKKDAEELQWTVYIRMELLMPIMKNPSCIQSEKQILQLAKDICSALIACHKRNILHRDIKPENIFIDSDGNYKIGDFGISRVVEHTTRASVGVGTYDYMSPEVINGNSYGLQADIYSLGMVLYYLMNEKRHPFFPLSPTAPTYEEKQEARNRKWSGEPIPPPKNGCAEFKRIIMKACAFAPDNRYLTVQNMLDELNQIDLEEKTIVQNRPVKPLTIKEKHVDLIEDGFDDDLAVTTVSASTESRSAKSSRSQSSDKDPRNHQSHSNGAHTGEKNNWKKWLLTIVTAIAVLCCMIWAALPKNSSPQEESDQVERNVLDRLFFKEICTEIEKQLSEKQNYQFSSLDRYLISLSFYDSVKPDLVNTVDVSKNNDGSVLAWWWIYDNICEIHIAADNGVIAPENCRELFAKSKNLQKINFNRSFITDHVTDMSFMFLECTGLESIDFSGIVTSNVTTMRYMFYSCIKLEKLDVSMFDTAKVTDMGKMFNQCENLYDLNLTGFNVSNVTDKNGMFTGTYKVYVPNSVCNHICIQTIRYDRYVQIDGSVCDICGAFMESEHSFYLDAEEMVPGNIFEYGIYEQDNDPSNGKEPIEWLVLARNGNEVLVVSLLGLDTLPYEYNKYEAVWETCSIRSWLEDEFYENAFIEREKKYILEKNVVQHKNNGYPACNQGNNTIDHVFLLSAYEYSEYLYNNKAVDAQYREGIPTQYALGKGIDEYDYYKGARCWWWLRTSSGYNDKACVVNALGPKEVEVGAPINKIGGLVRPAMWVTLK